MNKEFEKSCFEVFLWRNLIEVNEIRPDTAQWKHPFLGWVGSLSEVLRGEPKFVLN